MMFLRSFVTVNVPPCSAQTGNGAGTRLPISGILLGGVVDVISTGILAVPLVLYTDVRYGAVHAPKALHESIGLMMGQWVAGVLGSILGGYVAALTLKRSKRGPIRTAR